MKRLKAIQKKWSRRKVLSDRLLNLMDTSRAFGWGVGLAMFTISLVPKFSHDLNSDSTVYLFLAGRMLDGAKYYRDFFEFNTPFAIGIYAIPVALARLFHVFVPVAAKAFVMAVMLGSIVLSDCIIRRSRLWAGITRYNAIIIALFFSFSFPSSFYYNELTTKTPLFLCFIVPYMLSIQLYVERVPVPRRLQAALGALLGLALCLKPHYALFPLVMEGYLCWKRRSWFSWGRWSNVLAGVIAVAYYAIILPVFFPGYLKIIPFFFEYYDTAYLSWQYRVWEIFFICLMYALPFVVWYAVLRNVLKKNIPHDVLLAAIWASVAVLGTEKLLSGDQRSILNFFVCLPFLYSLLVLSRHLDAVKASISGFQKHVATFAVVFGVISVFGLVELVCAFDPWPRDREDVTAQMLEYVHKYAADDPIFAISDNTEHLTPELIYLSRRPYPVFHLQRLFFNVERRDYDYAGQTLSENSREAEGYAVRSLMDFFTHTPPKLVFVNEYNRYSLVGKYCLPQLLEILLRRYPQFAALWHAHYERIGTIHTRPERRIFDDKTPRQLEVTLGGKPYPVTLPPESALTTWLDVYKRKD